MNLIVSYLFLALFYWAGSLAPGLGSAYVNPNPPFASTIPPGVVSALVAVFFLCGPWFRWSAYRLPWVAVVAVTAFFVAGTSLLPSFDGGGDLLMLVSALAVVTLAAPVKHGEMKPLAVPFWQKVAYPYVVAPAISCGQWCAFQVVSAVLAVVVSARKTIAWVKPRVQLVCGTARFVNVVALVSVMRSKDRMAAHRMLHSIWSDRRIPDELCWLFEDVVYRPALGMRA